MDRKVRILFNSTLFTSFIREDFAILEKYFIVNKIIGSGILHIFNLFIAIPKSDVTYTWFASVYSAFVIFFSRLFGKKSIIVIGGVDVSKDQGINYGIWLNPWKSVFVKYALRNADLILSVDPFLIGEAKRLASYKGDNIRYLPTGYDSDFWKAGGNKEEFILSVGVCEDEWRMMKKGFDKLIQTAIDLPEFDFKIIGINEELKDKIKKDLPVNVEIISFVDRNELLKYYQKAKVYCQVSYTEGLPNSLCEAMACECIPVGTTRGGIPTGIGDTGILIEYGDLVAMKNAFKKTMNMNTDVGKKARQRVIENFSLSRRENGLKSLIEELNR